MKSSSTHLNNYKIRVFVAFLVTTICIVLHTAQTQAAVQWFSSVNGNYYASLCRTNNGRVETVATSISSHSGQYLRIKVRTETGAIAGMSVTPWAVPTVSLQSGVLNLNYTVRTERSTSSSTSSSAHSIFNDRTFYVTVGSLPNCSTP